MLDRLSQKSNHLRNAGQAHDTRLDQATDHYCVQPSDLRQLSIVGQCELMKAFRRQNAYMLAVQPVELGDGEPCTGLIDAVDIEGFDKPIQGEKLAVIGRVPAEQGDVVDDGLRQVAAGNQILERSISRALGKLLAALLDDMREVDIFRDGPTKTAVEQVVLGRGGKIFHSPRNMRDAHQVIVDHIRKVIGREAVRLKEHLVIQQIVSPGDHTVDVVFERRYAALGNALANDVRLPSGSASGSFLCGEEPTGVVGSCRPGRGYAIGRGFFHGFVVVLFNSLNRWLGFSLAAEAAIRAAQLHELLRVLPVERSALALYVGAVIAALVGTLIVVQAGQPEAVIDDLHRVIHIAAPVRVFDAQYELTTVVTCDEIGVQRSTQIPDVHIACRAGRKTGPDQVFPPRTAHVTVIMT